MNGKCCEAKEGNELKRIRKELAIFRILMFEWIWASFVGGASVAIWGAITNDLTKSLIVGAAVFVVFGVLFQRKGISQHLKEED